MRDVDREAQLGNPLAPPLQVAPVATDRRQEDPDSHSQHWRHVLDQRLDSVAEAGLGVEAKEALDVVIRGDESGPVPAWIDRREQVDRQHRGADCGREPGAALDAVAGLRIEVVHSHVGAARPTHRCLGGHAQPKPLQLLAGDLDRAGQCLVVVDVAGEQADLEPAPRATLEPVG